MREILFRGKRKDNGRWVRGFPFAVHSGLKIEGIETWDGERHLVDTETVGQFTGVLDTNGKKVFEGDIVKLTEDVKKTFDVDDGVIKFNHSAFFVNGGNGLRDSLFALVDYTYVLRGWVIGNIHDNPETRY